MSLFILLVLVKILNSLNYDSQSDRPRQWMLNFKIKATTIFNVSEIAVVSELRYGCNITIMHYRKVVALNKVIKQFLRPKGGPVGHRQLSHGPY